MTKLLAARYLAGATCFSLFQNYQNACGFQLASSSTGNSFFFSGFNGPDCNLAPSNAED